VNIAIASEIAIVIAVEIETEIATSIAFGKARSRPATRLIAKKEDLGARVLIGIVLGLTLNISTPCYHAGSLLGEYK
jgi:hypothetical protein